MKVGILTFHNAHNYGAVLQAYALKTYVKSLGYEAQIINYFSDNMLKECPKEKDIKIDFTTRKNIYDSIEWLYAKKDYLKKWENFDKFIDFLLEGQRTAYTKEDVEKLDLDYIICGSDQIWNPEITNGLEEVYFGNFNTRAKKIAYAASMGIPALPKEEEILFRSYLSNFDGISVREESLQRYIKKVANLSVRKMLDPTLLLRAEDYEPLMVDQNNGDYLFLYTLIPDQRLYKIAEKMAKRLHLKIIEVAYEKELSKIDHKQVPSASPSEFLSYIKNAKFVVTNSFHGTIFSLIFNKEFYAVEYMGQNLRMQNILSITNTKERYIRLPEEAKVPTPIDFETVNRNLENERKFAYDFLKNALDVYEEEEAYTQS